jgi:hypothetical protein
LLRFNTSMSADAQIAKEHLHHDMPPPYHFMEGGATS